MASINALKAENVRYVDAELVTEDDSDNVEQLEIGEDEYNVAYTNDANTVYVQQGQYVIPVGGHAVVLQDDQGDFEQYIINNIAEDLQDTDQTDDDMTQPVYYYTGQFADQSQIFEDQGDVPESTDDLDENIVEETVAQSQKRMKLEQAYVEEYQLEQTTNDVEETFVEVQENIGSGKIVIDSSSDQAHLQQQQYQYAILKNGKLHLQTLDIMDAAASSQFNMEDSSQHQQLQEQLAAFQQSINMDDASVTAATVDLDKITGKNLITGQTVTLDSYFDKLQQRLASVDVAEQCFSYNSKKKRRNSSFNEQGSLTKGGDSAGAIDGNYINKKVVVGKTASGKRIVGKILRVHKTGGGSDTDSAQKETSQSENKRKNSVVATSSSSTEVLIPSNGSGAKTGNDKDLESSATVKPITNVTSSAMSEESSQSQQQPHIIIKKHVVTRENFDYSIGKTLAGLMGLETVQRRLQNKNLVVKLVEKAYNRSTNLFNRTVSYVYGHLELVHRDEEKPENQRWAFVLHNENDSSVGAIDGDDIESVENGGVASLSDDSNEEKTSEDAKTVCSTENDEESDEIKDVSLEIEDTWNRYNETASVTILITVDKNGKKSTRVNLNPQQRDNLCRVCTKEFKSAMQMRKHLNNVHLCERSAKCELCNKNFASQAVLQRHRKIHTGERWFQCPKCSKSFNTAGSLKRHLTVHDRSLRPLECSVCVQRFTDESSLRKHLLIHTGIRAYACEICNRAFVNQGDLNFHRRIHDPVKQFSCDVCGREFSRHSNLMRHIEIHRGVGALHRCDICGCSYSFVSSLTRHIVQKHIGQQQ